MRKRLGFIFFVFVILCLAGCRESNPDLRIEQKSGDLPPQADDAAKAENPAAKAITDIGSNAKIVTGVPATTDDKKEEAVEPQKDKTGAVAVKMEY